MKELKNIQDFLQQVSGAFAAVVDIELAIIDSRLEVIAGTGRYAKEVGFVYGEGCMTHQVLSLSEDKCVFVTDTRSSQLCSECKSFQSCEVLAAAMCPISYMHKNIGAISLLALDPNQQGKLIREYKKMAEFLHRISNFIVTTINEKKMEARVNILANQFKAVINSVHEGIISIDAAGSIVNINKSAQDLLGLDAKWVGAHISSIFPGFSVEEIFSEKPLSKEDFYGKEINYSTNSKVLPLYCSITLMQERDEVIGAVISFRKREEMRKIAGKIMGEDKKYTLDAIKGSNSHVIEIKKKMKRVANTDSTILIQGDTGTGKSLFARAIHEESYRKGKAFVAVNCAAIPASLLESELFGYEEGAFTGAKKGGKPGKFEMAHEGTLFLDEIGDMPLSFQVKLLQVIESKKIERIGGVKSRHVDVRIIAATNQNLEELIKKGQFREDLFYRLNVIPFLIPPLKERKEDILLLMYFFLTYYTAILSKEITGFHSEAKEILLNYPWPGNIRELENAVEYAVNIEVSDVITVESLPAKVLHYEKGSDEGLTTLDQLEQRAIKRALGTFGQTTKGKEKAAAALGISRATLYRKLKEQQS